MAWNKSSENGEAVSRPLQKRKGFRFPVRGAIAGAIVVVGAGIVAWLLWPNAKPPLSTLTPTATSTSLIKEVKPAAASTGTLEKVEVTIHGEKKTVEVSEKDGYRYMKYPSGRVVRTKNPYLMKAMQEQADRYAKEPRPVPDPNAPKPRYKNPATAVLAQYAVPGLDSSSPPGPISDKEGLAIINEKIEILPDDTEDEIVEKEYLVEMQQELREHMEKGGRAEDYFNKAYARQQMEAEAVNTARQEIKALVNEGKTEDAMKALETYNDYLKAKGIRPIKASKGLFRAKRKR